MAPTVIEQRGTVLFVVSQPELLDELLRLAAAAGVTPEVAVDVTAARRSWTNASLIVLDEVRGQQCVKSHFPWRAGVVIAALSSAAGEPTQSAWRLAGELGADHVALLPEAESWLIDRLSRPLPMPDAAKVVGVVGGRGGAGASVFATALGIGGVQLGHRVLLIDADPLGAGLDLTLGQESAPGTRWAQLTNTVDLPTTTTLFDALPKVGELAILAWDRNEISAVPLSAMNSALDFAVGCSDLVVVDLPRYPDESSIAAMARSDLTLLVVPAEVRAVFAAARVAGLATVHCQRLECVIRGPAPAGLRAIEIAEALRLPLAGTVKAEPRLGRALEQGIAPELLRAGSLATFCRGVIGRLGIGVRLGGEQE